MEDINIIGLFLEREETALQEVSKKYSNYCFGVAWNLLSNREDSEECVNDTWLAAWQYIPPQKPSKLSVFLGKITRGFAIDCLRKRYAAKRMDRHITDITGELENLNHTLVYTLDESMERQEVVEVIDCFLRSLSEIDRDIFIRRYWYTDSIKNIMERHGISQSSIKSKLFRSRNKLQKMIVSQAEKERGVY